MNQRKHLTLVAAGASLLASLPLESVFDSWTWLVDAFLITLALGGAALLLRSLRAPVWAPTLGMLAAGVLVLTWIFPPEGGSIIPTLRTFTNFNTLLQQAGTDMSQYAAPVPDRPGFLFLATLGVGGVVVVIDLFAVVLRRPALAGLPMLAIYSVPVAVKDDSVNMIPFLLGAAGFLWLLVTDNVDRVRRFGRRFTGDGRDVDLWEPSPLAAAGQRLGLIGLVIAVVIPLILPGMTSGGLLSQWAGTGGAGVTGGNGRGTSVGLFADLSGELNRDKSTELLKVTNTDTTPGYLRFGVADQLGNGGFTARQFDGGSSVKSLPGPTFNDAYGPTTYKAQIDVTNLTEQYLPDYLWTTKVDKLSGSWQYDANTSMIFSDRDVTKGKKYTIEYRKLRTPGIADLRQVADPAQGSAIERQYATVPDNDTVRTTVQKLIAGKTTEYDKVLAILDSFSTNNGFTYDLKTGQQTSSSAIESFLKNKRGFCVQYAAAMAWLVRQAKYPARVAFGFTVGTKQGSTMTLTNFNLHAWTEVYFQGYGWLTFDATPASSVPGSVSPTYAPNPSLPLNTGPNEPDKDTPQVNSSTGAGASAAAQGPDQTANHGQAGGKNSGSSFLSVLVLLAKTLGIVVLLGLVLFSAALARWRTRRQREKYSTSLAARARAAGLRPPDGPPGPASGPSGPGAAPPPGTGFDGGAVSTLAPGQVMVAEREDWLNEAARLDAHQAWDELVDAMTDYRVAVDPAETPRTTVERVTATERLKEGPQGALRRLSTAEEFARYAKAPVLDPTLLGSVGELRRSFASRANRGIRIRAILLPPSVTDRWRARIWNRFTDVSNWTGGRRDAAVRGLSVRRRLTKKKDT